VQLRPHPLDPALEVLERPLIVHKDVGHLCFCFQRQLCGDPGLDVALRHTPISHQPLDLGGHRCGYHDETVEGRVHAGLDQQGRAEHHHPIRGWFPLPSFGEHPPHLRVHDAFQIATGCGVGEDDAGQRLTVEPAPGSEHVGAEPLDHLIEAGGPGRHCLTGQDVGVEDDGTPFLQHPCHRGLTGTDPAGEADEKHRNGYSGRPSRRRRSSKMASSETSSSAAAASSGGAASPGDSGVSAGSSLGVPGAPACPRGAAGPRGTCSADAPSAASCVAGAGSSPDDGAPSGRISSSSASISLSATAGKAPPTWRIDKLMRRRGTATSMTFTRTWSPTDSTDSGESTCCSESSEMCTRPSMPGATRTNAPKGTSFVT